MITWDSRHGAILLPNIDDDDGDGAADADDELINGDDDLLDLSPMVLSALPSASGKATLTIDVPEEIRSAVRLFVLRGGADPASAASYDLAALPYVLMGDALHDETHFAVEGRTVVTSTTGGGFDGQVRIQGSLDADAAKALGLDETQRTSTAVMRVAPVLFQYNTAPTKRVLYSDEGRDTQSLVDGITPAAMADGALSILGMDLSLVGGAGDVWAQDYIDFAVMTRPTVGGVQQIRVAVHSAQTDRDAGNMAMKYFRGKDYGSVYIFDEKGSASDSSYSMNSFGNWDVIPPYDKGDEHYPLGRNLWGSTGKAGTSPDPVFADFVRAQAVQPEVNIDTSWLFVGHVDEFTSFVKSRSARGFAFLVADTTLARSMLQGLVDAGKGSTPMFVGLTTYDFNGNSSPAEVSVSDVLANADLMAESQKAQMYIDEGRQKLKDAIGLGDDEIVMMPGLFEEIDGGGLAYVPGTVNLLHLDGRVVIPDPFGPSIDGADFWKTDLTKRLAPLGLELYYADDWYTFHINAGEVHCGSNVERDMPLKWWETGR